MSQKNSYLPRPGGSHSLLAGRSRYCVSALWSVGECALSPRPSAIDPDAGREEMATATPSPTTTTTAAATTASRLCSRCSRGQCDTGYRGDTEPSDAENVGPDGAHSVEHDRGHHGQATNQDVSHPSDNGSCHVITSGGTLSTPNKCLSPLYGSNAHDDAISVWNELGQVKPLRPVVSERPVVRSS